MCSSIRKPWPTRVCSDEYQSLHGARRRVAPGTHPDPNSPAYKATELRHPKQPLIIIPQTLTEFSGPVYGHDASGHPITI